MYKIYVSILIGIGVTAVIGQKPCCGPTKWTANIIQTVGEYNEDTDKASLRYGNTTMYYDYDNKQLAFKQTLLNLTDDTVVHRWIIKKYNEGYRYRYEIINGTCKNSTLKEDMEKPCIPDDATFFGKHSLPGDLNINVWFVESKELSGTRRISVTEKTCVRTSMSRLSPGPDFVLDIGVYQNVTDGISDPGVFVVPSYCGSTDEVPFPAHEEEIKSIY